MSDEMTREQAIGIITLHREHWQRLMKGNVCSKQEGEESIAAFDVALAALSAVLCKNAISRESVLSIIEENQEDDADEWMDYPWKVTPNLLMDEMRKLPPVTPSVIDDIKAEIKQKREENRNGEYDKIFELCLLIIDKHTSGKEQA